MFYETPSSLVLNVFLLLVIDSIVSDSGDFTIQFGAFYLEEVAAKTRI